MWMFINFSLILCTSFQLIWNLVRFCFLFKNIVAVKYHIKFRGINFCALVWRVFIFVGSYVHEQVLLNARWLLNLYFIVHYNNTNHQYCGSCSNRVTPSLAVPDPKMGLGKLNTKNTSTAGMLAASMKLSHINLVMSHKLLSHYCKLSNDILIACVTSVKRMGEEVTSLAIHSTAILVWSLANSSAVKAFVSGKDIFLSFQFLSLPHTASNAEYWIPF